jgi:serine/threonine protein kinase
VSLLQLLCAFLVLLHITAAVGRMLWCSHPRHAVQISCLLCCARNVVPVHGLKLIRYAMCVQHAVPLLLPATVSHCHLTISCMTRPRLLCRDVKAGNVLVDGEGNVKLGDFGVAGEVQSVLQVRTT